MSTVDPADQTAGQPGAAYYAALVEHSHDAILTTDVAGTITSWNPAAARLYGYAPADVLGRPVTLLARAQDAADVLDTLAVVAAGTRVEPFDAVRVHRSGRELDVSIGVAPVRDADGEIVGVSWIERDVTGRRHVERMITHLAFHDPLTGLANRTLLLERLQHALERAERDGGLVAVVYLDLDDFKVVNDRLGHAAGDRLLQMVANRLQAWLRPSDTLARLGGDEFVVCSEQVPGPEVALGIAERLRDALAAPFELETSSVTVSASFGVSLAGAGTDPDRVLADADRAMYSAKAQGGATIASPAAPAP